STPRQVLGDRVPYTSFRLATTARWFDNRIGAWTDGPTEWFTVKAFRDVAFNVAASVSKGDPVVVHGRLRTEVWSGDDGPRTTLVLEAAALGHDLTRGTARFARTVRVAAGPGSDATPAQDLVPDGGSPDAYGAPDDEADDDGADAAGGVEGSGDREDAPWDLEPVAAGGQQR
ncbi:MAG TPA: single-stranded DNA-binding protein, partial [Actinotalea sp.]|nr:single-stranded DNA-binding protein [Actinotalea sp.]